AGISSARLVDEMRASGHLAAHYVAKRADVATTLAPQLRDGDILITRGDGDVAWDEPMSRHTTLRLGGPVDAYASPGSLAALERLRAACSARGIRSRAFGSGSNLLVRDGGLRGCAISLEKLRDVRIERRTDDGAELWLDAGASTGKVLSFATRENLGGVEFLGGVPGTVGGGMIMNAGTYLGEFKDVTTEVHAVDEGGALVVRDNAQCGFRYRHSDIPASDVVTGARLKLKTRA